MQMNLSTIAQILHLQQTFVTDAVVQDVVFDSRKVTPNSLFVPLVAQRDGHDFVPQALAAGAVATLWQSDHPLPAGHHENYLVVDDPLSAIQTLSQAYLHEVAPKVVAITGSNGKTTTKDMIAAVLSQKYQVAKTPTNFNNEIGVPLTILQMAPDTQILVVELGMDRPGQLTKLSALVQPDIAVITMIGEAHIEFFGTRAKIADAKMEIVSSLKPSGLFIYNGSEPLLVQRAAAVTQKQATFGRASTLDIYPSTIQTYQTYTTFRINLVPEFEFRLPLMGDYNVDNALAAILVGKQFQVDFQKIQEALAHFQPTKNRTQWLQAQNGAQILSDVYNANPTAMIDVIQNFQKILTTGRRILVLGDMLELGEQAPQLHAEVAQAIDLQAIAQVYLYGSEMRALRDALPSQLSVQWYSRDQKVKLIQDLQEILQPQDLILLKASNGLHLDEVVQALQKSN
ncbi:UDP-N-acetylmuramoyl-tripeptide--D-alanyl-D-alanine ligase [Bombilactobacillus folatiphilus]|uniref:UDP-N-acetylmuramoyl-tripeptide--D-alanyl-D-alanine ligase n=1 Tax=Bombilactobacillus folatiphilus TaxID=2923362 RepID=A0ABY4P9A7_9LACO|nr:UDP-N-acetylmuramoyl-tripeptide--D-alanyl-D-alanine ligase [Bombilactobacillus folatiphilus]UQS82318.1 UDP-N-acetylmuramoyl-tripeptide--D-alanyl-D-alanine ligase [Bombilactobacillus folatiphilus]